MKAQRSKLEMQKKMVANENSVSWLQAHEIYEMTGVFRSGLKAVTGNFSYLLNREPKPKVEKLLFIFP